MVLDLGSSAILGWWQTAVGPRWKFPPSFAERTVYFSGIHTSPI